MASTAESFIFATRLKNGQFVIGESKKPAVTIASLNSGNYPIAERHSIKDILGIRIVNEERTLESTREKFEQAYGKENVTVLSA